MKFLLLISLLFVQNAMGQKSLVDVFKHHRFSCDNESTTLALNLCSREKINFADSLLKRLYLKVQKSLDKEINQHSIEYAKKQNVSLDSSYKAFLNTERKHYVRLKQMFVQSQQTWLKMREENYRIAKNICDGGTGCPAIANAVYLSDILDRIKRLEDFRLL